MKWKKCKRKLQLELEDYIGLVSEETIENPNPSYKYTEILQNFIEHLQRIKEELCEII